MTFKLARATWPPPLTVPMKLLDVDIAECPAYLQPGAVIYTHVHEPVQNGRARPWLQIVLKPEWSRSALTGHAMPRDPADRSYLDPATLWPLAISHVYDQSGDTKALKSYLGRTVESLMPDLPPVEFVIPEEREAYNFTFVPEVPGR